MYQKLIPASEALNRVLQQARPNSVERVALVDAWQRIVAEDLISDSDVPPITNSAMDGYAVRSSDTRGESKELRVIEQVEAGHAPSQPVLPGQCIRIMTGASIPEGADAVVPKEDTRVVDQDRIEILSAVSEGANVRLAGEDIRAGATVLSRKTMIRAAEMGVVASLGRCHVDVFRRPAVAIVATGDEVVEPGAPKDPLSIYSSNSYSLMGLIRESGGRPIYLGIAPDRVDEISEKVAAAAGCADVILTTGGVSVGEHDLVKAVLEGLGIEEGFWGVNMRPGRPLFFGRLRGKPLFGLPGNPVAVMVTFEQFVRPLLLKLQGLQSVFRPIATATITTDLKHKPGRIHFVRAVLSRDGQNLLVEPTGYQGSGVLTSMQVANCFIVMGEGDRSARAGDRVRVQVLDRSFDDRREPGW